MSAAEVAANTGSYGQGAREAAGALLGRLAAETIVLRMPATPTPGNDGEQLGLASPEFTDISITPAAIRVQSGRTVASVAALALEKALGVDDESKLRSVLNAASFVQIGDRNFILEAIERRSVYGRAYLYRMLLRDPAAVPATTKGTA